MATKPQIESRATSDEPRNSSHEPQATSDEIMQNKPNFRKDGNAPTSLLLTTNNQRLATREAKNKPKQTQFSIYMPLLIGLMCLRILWAAFIAALLTILNAVCIQNPASSIKNRLSAIASCECGRIQPPETVSAGVIFVIFPLTPPTG